MKVPKPVKQKCGDYAIQFRFNGQSIIIKGATEKECTKNAQLYKAEYQAGKRAVSKNEITCRQAIDNHIKKKPNLSASTVRGYTIIQNNRFKKYMDLPLAKVDWKKAFEEEAQIVKPKTLKNSMALIKTVLSENKIPLLDGIEVPKVNKRANERPWLNYEEVDIFVKAVVNKKFAIPALLALHGMRRSEIYAITPDKIDLKHGKYGIINVRGAVVPDKDNKFVYKKENKSEAGTRHVPIMIPELKELLVAKHGEPFDFGHPDTLRRQIKRTCEKAGITPVTTHGLRHSFASLCQHLGVPEDDCAMMGGWDDRGTMHEIYTHLADADIDRYSKELTTFFEAREERERSANRTDSNSDSKTAEK